MNCETLFEAKPAVRLAFPEALLRRFAVEFGEERRKP